MEIKNKINQLIGQLQQKEKKLEALLDLTRKQREWIGKSDFEKIALLLEDKQHIMDEIDRFDVIFLEAYHTLKKSLGVGSLNEIDPVQYPELKGLKQEVHRVMECLKQIDAVDQENTRRIQEGFQKVQEEMKELKMRKQRTKMALRYKNKYAGAQGLFIDNKKRD